MKNRFFLSFIILVHVGIPNSGRFFLTAESLGTNAVVITRFLCICYSKFGQDSQETRLFVY